MPIEFTLTALDVSSAGNVSAAGLRSLCDGLSSNQSIQSLRIAGGGFTTDDCLVVAKYLHLNPPLLDLDLSHNAITDVGDLAEALESNKTLRTLTLAHNKIDDAGFILLLQSLIDKGITTLFNQFDIFTFDSQF